jgi:hypothetical protein
LDVLQILLVILKATNGRTTEMDFAFQQPGELLPPAEGPVVLPPAGETLTLSGPKGTELQGRAAARLSFKGRLESFLVGFERSPSDGRSSWVSSLSSPRLWQVWLDLGIFTGFTLGSFNPWTGLAAAAAFRAGLLINSLFNEAGHIFQGLRLGYGRAALNLRNVLGTQPWTVLLMRLVPFMLETGGDLVTRIDSEQRDHFSAIRKGGFWVGAGVSLTILTVLVSGLFLGGQGTPAAGPSLLAYGLGTALAVGLAFLTDMTRLTEYAYKSGLHACGNMTILSRLQPGEKSAFPVRMQRLFERMNRINQMRGGQAGGLAVQYRQGRHARHVIRKRVNSKRGDLVQRMRKDLAGAAESRRAFEGVTLVQGHTRYATSGPSFKHEAHPFQWFSEVKVRRVISLSGGRPEAAAAPVETTIAHNGDMDRLAFPVLDENGSWKPARLDYPFLAYWLERVLHAPNRWKGDSPQIAGAMELFVTQGLWAESLRLAYHRTAVPAPDFSSVTDGMKDKEKIRKIRGILAAHPAPSLKVFRRWAQTAEEIFFEETKDRFFTDDAKSLKDTRSGRRERLVERLAGAFQGKAFDEIPADRARVFAEAAVEAFLENDLYTAARKVKSSSEGTFGMVMTTTLQPNQVVATSHRQPLSLGFHRAHGTVGVPSERATLKVKASGEAGADAAFDERLDLDLALGEIAHIELKKTTVAKRASRWSNGYSQ